MWSIVLILFAAPVVGLALGADEPQAKGAKKAAKLVAAKTADEAAPADAAKARQTAAALRDLQAALRDDASAKGKGKAPAVTLPERPKKVVTPPTLDPAGLDSLVEKALAKAKAPVPPVTTDEEFVRRVYLDLTGKLPNFQEMRAFLGSRDKQKRAKLIDMLLASPTYGENWARYWRDVISYRAPEQQPNRTNYPSFEAWLSGELNKNRPWDEIATAMITAEGPTREVGASAFGIAETGQAVEMAGEVSRVFMGVQIQCAQCHDHPTDPWKRQQFHEFASFFAGLSVKRANPQGENPPIFALAAANQKVPRYTMPDKADPTKQIPVEPKFFLKEDAPKVAGLTSDQRRALAASYITGQDNPWFAKAFVNRVWGVLMGEGFFTPVDDLGPTKEGHDPEVLDALAAEWQKGGYDVKWLYRTILNTKSYQRESRSSNSAAGRTPFAANCPSTLRADQVFDALAQALDLPAETFNRARNGKAIGAGKGDPNAQAAKAIKAAVDKKMEGAPEAAKKLVAQMVAMRNGPRAQFNRTFGFDPSTPVDDVMGTIPQALFLMNSPQVNGALKATNNSMLGELLQSTPDNRAVLEVLYLRTLARRPNAKEVNVCGRYVEMVGNRVEAFEDILWSLLNSTEFVSRR
jgi:hypothetical protein